MACSGDSSPRLAVLGVLSTEERLPLRSAIRRTWARTPLTFPSSPSSLVLPRFVMRVINASSAVLAEAASQGDVVLVRAPARAERAKGPLLSLFLWFRCALVAWPAARMIGKVASLVRERRRVLRGGRRREGMLGEEREYGWDRIRARGEREVECPGSRERSIDREKAGGRGTCTSDLCLHRHVAPGAG